MPTKSISVFKLTPAQIALVDRLGAPDSNVTLDALNYPEIVAYQELAKLGMADMNVARRRKVTIVLTDLGTKVRANGYVSEKAVLHLTGPQIATLRFLASGQRHFNEIPGTMIDVCRRMTLRGWAKYEIDERGQYWARITTEGWQILKLLDV